MNGLRELIKNYIVILQLGLLQVAHLFVGLYLPLQ